MTTVNATLDVKGYAKLKTCKAVACTGGATNYLLLRRHQLGQIDLQLNRLHIVS